MTLSLCEPQHRFYLARDHHTTCAPQVALVVMNTPANAGDLRDAVSIPGSRRSPGGGHGNPLQYSGLENPRNRGAWQATVHGVAKSQTRLKWVSTRQSPLSNIMEQIQFHPMDLWSHAQKGTKRNLDIGASFSNLIDDINIHTQLLKLYVFETLI